MHIEPSNSINQHLHRNRLHGSLPQVSTAHGSLGTDESEARARSNNPGCPKTPTTMLKYGLKHQRRTASADGHPSFIQQGDPRA